MGSASFLDSIFEKVENAIVISDVDDRPKYETTGLVIDNCLFKDVETAVSTMGGEKLLGAAGGIKHWSLGPVYKDGKRTWARGVELPYIRNETLLAPEANGLPLRPFFERKRNQYIDANIGSFMFMKDFGAAGMFYRLRLTPGHGKELTQPLCKGTGFAMIQKKSNRHSARPPEKV